MRAVSRRHRITADLTATPTGTAVNSTTTAATATATATPRPSPTKWMFSWRRLQTCLLQPYSPHRRHTNTSSHGGTNNGGSVISTNTEESVSGVSCTATTITTTSTTTSTTTRPEELPEATKANAEAKPLLLPLADGTTLLDAVLEAESSSSSSSTVQRSAAEDTREPAEADEEEADVDSVQGVIVMRPDDPVQIKMLVKEPASVSPPPPPPPVLWNETATVQVDSSSLSSSADDCPPTFRRGVSAPPATAGTAIGTGTPSTSLCSSAPPKLPPPSSSGHHARMILPPKAPGRPQLMARRLSSTASTNAIPFAGGGAPARPRLDSTVTTGTAGTNASLHRRRQNNDSFEFSVDSLQMIIQDEEKDATLLPSGSSSPERQVSENSWSTLPVSSIQIGVLERDCSELMTEDVNEDDDCDGDDFEKWGEDDSLVMSSDEDGASVTSSCGGKNESGETTATATSPSPTSVVTLDNSVQQQEPLVVVPQPPPSAQQLPDWMLQWAKQPSTNDYLSEEGIGQEQGEEEQPNSSQQTPAIVCVEPTYLPIGPKPEGCTFSAYMAVSLGEESEASSSEEEDDDADDVRLVQVIGSKLVVVGMSVPSSAAAAEMPLNRETRIQPQTLEDDPRRVVVVRNEEQEWKLFPVALVPCAGKDGTFFRRAPPVSKPLVVSSEQHEKEEEDEEKLSSHVAYSCRSFDMEFDDDSQQCEAVLHLVFLLDACCRQQAQ